MTRTRWMVAVAGVGLAAVGALHAPGLTARLGMGACPWSRTPSPERVEAMRVAQAAALRGGVRANARPASGFVLDVSTRGDVRAWADKEHARCRDELGGAAMRCERDAERNGDAASTPSIRDAYFRFNPRGVLVGVDLMHAGTTATQAAELLGTLVGQVEREAGRPSTVSGVPAAAHLDQGYMSRTSAEFRYSDYAADLSATNFGDRGVVVRQQYRSLSGG